MKPTWKKYLLYGSVLIIGGSLLFILIQTIRAKNTGFETKTLWDWMELLIIPLILAIGAFYLNKSERTVEREIAMDRQREVALQAYLDHMAELLIQEQIRTSENQEIRNVARIRTLTVLRGLDDERKGTVLLFLKESGLINRPAIVDLRGANFDDVSLVNPDLEGITLRQVSLVHAFLPYVRLNGADLSFSYPKGADLRGAFLRGADLVGIILTDADLTGADLSRSKLHGASLERTNLYNANLTGADLSGARFIGANLTNANLTGAVIISIDAINRNDEVDEVIQKYATFADSILVGAKLIRVNMMGADLQTADLRNADLTDANLTGVKISHEQLMTTKTLKGAIMPDGTKHD
jgi:uncharacterized protein YjbI with pentapeptide repeats